MASCDNYLPYFNVNMDNVVGSIKNIVFDNNDIPKLCDFGMAAIEGTMPLTGLKKFPSPKHATTLSV